MARRVRIHRGSRRRALDDPPPGWDGEITPRLLRMERNGAIKPIADEDGGRSSRHDDATYLDILLRDLPPSEVPEKS